MLKTGDTGYIVASFNTRTFQGEHSATLTLTVEWDDNGVRRIGEGQVRVHGNIRSDVVFTPGAVKFESVDQGKRSEQQVRVTYAGRSDWKITDVRGASDDIEVELAESQRTSGRVAYDLIVRMKDNAPAGYFNEQLVLVTNDGSNPRIPLHVEGRVVPEISVAPRVAGVRRSDARPAGAEEDSGSRQEAVQDRRRDERCELLRVQDGQTIRRIATWWKSCSRRARTKAR